MCGLKCIPLWPSRLYLIEVLIDHRRVVATAHFNDTRVAIGRCTSLAHLGSILQSFTVAADLLDGGLFGIGLAMWSSMEIRLCQRNHPSATTRIGVPVAASRIGATIKQIIATVAIPAAADAVRGHVWTRQDDVHLAVTEPSTVVETNVSAGASASVDQAQISVLPTGIAPVSIRIRQTTSSRFQDEVTHSFSSLGPRNHAAIVTQLHLEDFVGIDHLYGQDVAVRAHGDTLHEGGNTEVFALGRLALKDVNSFVQLVVLQHIILVVVVAIVVGAVE